MPIKPSHFSAFLRDDDGATAIEYALIAIMMSLAIIAGATAIGTNLVPIFQSAAAGMAV